MRINIRDKNNFINMFNRLFKDNKILEVNGVSIDSRKVQKNDIYIPIKGEKYDGHNFIEEALNHGAIKCFSEQETTIHNVINIDSSIKIINTLAKKWNEISNHTIIGITGSNGKTTTKEILFNILSQKNKCSKSLGNHNSRLGLPISYLNSKKEDKYCIIEYGASKPQEIENLCKIIKPNISIITNISNAHIKNYNSILDIYETKKSIFKCLKREEKAFKNLDDEYIRKDNYHCNTLTYSLFKEADYRGKESIKKKEKILSINNRKIFIKKELQHLTNIILPVYAIATELGIKHNEIINILNEFTLPKGRGKSFYINQVEVIDDSYNANPSSVILAIDRLDSIIKNDGNKIFILGDMLELGEHSKKEHKKIGQYINKTKINIVITYGEKSVGTFTEINNMKIQKFHFNKMNALKISLMKILNKNDTVYLKGSRSMKLEKIYEAGLA